jgi:hypothetical protein
MNTTRLALASLMVASAFVALAFGCDGAGAPGTDRPEAATPDDASEDAGPAPPPGACVESTTVSSNVRVEWFELDEDAGVVRELDTDGFVRLAWAYDPSRRLVIHAGFGKGTYDNFQQDFRYDGHGNLSDEHQSYPPSPSLTTPSSSAVSSGTRYDSTYDDAGALASTVATGYGTTPPPGFRRLFYENAAHQCDRIETYDVNDGGLTSVETRTYDGSGRLTRSERSGPGFFCVSGVSVTTIAYDDQGRVTSTSSSSCDGQGSTTTTYLPDGTQRVEQHIASDSNPSSSVTIRSVTCATLDGWRGAQSPTSRCAF